MEQKVEYMVRLNKFSIEIGGLKFHFYYFIRSLL